MDQSLRYLPFHAERAQVETDSDRHAISYAQVAPLVDFLPRSGQPYRAEWVMARSGAVTVLGGTSTPVLIELSEHHAKATLHVPSSGEGRYRVEGRQLLSTAGQTALYLPGLPHRCETGPCAGLSVGLDPQRLAATAARLAGDPDGADRYLPRFQQPLLFDQADPLVAHLLEYLQRVVALIDLEPSRNVDLPANLPIDALIEQAVAVLAVPTLAGH